MSKITWQRRSYMRKGSARVLGRDAVLAFCHLGESQPLLLSREPDNPVHAGAVLVSDLIGFPCGYVAREHSGEVSAKMMAGEVVLAKTIGPCLCVARRILLWTEGEVVELEETESTIIGDGRKIKIRERA